MSPTCDNTTCKVCRSDYSFCSVCSDGYIWTGSGCVVCPASCPKCSNNICKGCNIGTFMQNNYCFDCLPNCKVCTDSWSCRACNEGYTLTEKDFRLVCEVFSSNSTTIIIAATVSSVVSLLIIIPFICWLRKGGNNEAETLEAESM